MASTLDPPLHVLTNKTIAYSSQRRMPPASWMCVTAGPNPVLHNFTQALCCFMAGFFTRCRLRSDTERSSSGQSSAISVLANILKGTGHAVI